MTTRHPPRVATWLLMRLASGRRHESLVGDLMQQYQHGRSSGWYWRQVATSIAAGACRDLGDHIWLSLAMLGLWWLLTGVAANLALSAYQSLGLWMWNWTVEQGWDTVRAVWFGRPRWSNPPLLVMSCVNAALIGWLIARLSRGHAAATLLVAVAFNVLYVTALRWLAPNSLSPIILAPMPYVSRTAFVVAVVAVPLSFLAGGLVGARPSGDQQEVTS